MLDKETFGERLKRLRKKQGLNQTQLGNLCLVSVVTVNRWEQGIRQPRMEELKRLASALHVSEDELLNGVPEQNAWVLHVEIGNTKEDFLDMAKIAVTPVSAIITDREAGFLKIGGSYELWTDDNLFKKVISDLKKLREAVIANGRALGGIKE